MQAAVSSEIIISYDGSSNDDDAIVLGKMLGRTGASMALAYVRHAREFDPRREELAQHDAERRLQQGAALLGDPDIPQHVVMSASTGEGLGQLASAENASVIVFGSDYRTPPGHCEPGTTAQRLLEGGMVPIAVAAAGLRTIEDPNIETILPYGSDPDPTVRATAEALAAKLGATIVEEGSDPGAKVDLIVVGSPPGATTGRIALAGSVRYELSLVRGSVLVLPRDVAVQL
jgi:nucleotide-binding universal stress UspA family protein